MRALAAELTPYDITVNAICPGYVDTPMTDGSIANMVQRTGMSEQQAREALEQTSPQNRLIAPEEVASLVAFVASEKSAATNGAALRVEGGVVRSIL